ncbi:MAG: membrane protein insertase YidC [Alphaproteobacteria bacterium]
MYNPNEQTNYTRMLIAMLFAGLILMTWQALVELPRRKHLAELAAKQKQQQEVLKAQHGQQLAASTGTVADEKLTRSQRLQLAPRVHFSTEKLDGSISLKGARFDDLTLSQYRMTLDADSPPVTLFSPNGDPYSYFVQAGWVAADSVTEVPDNDTLWQADKNHIGVGEPVTLRWTNNSGITYFLTITLDEHYMFSVRQRVENRSRVPVAVTPYAYINRVYDQQWAHQSYAILHEGPLGVMDGTLEEISYSDMQEENRTFKDASGWFGITDKYWLSALVPGDSSFTTQFNHYKKGEHDRYQVDYMGAPQTIKPDMQAESNFRLFAGAKEIRQLDAYAEGKTGQPTIPLFDRAVDFGVLYFLTKPMFLMLNWFYSHVGNFGVAILLMTIIVKLVMFPMANKSYKSASQMRRLQPQMQNIRDRYGDDQIRLQQEMMDLYKREKVNPAAGCLPILIQMPVFFALYKVLFVTIEMRHAPFILWIKDLSALDPTNLFTLFGLLEWNHPAWMHLGVLPILMCVTMVIQMKQQPKPTDPVQAKVIAYMPYFFLIIFATFPAGLVLYWVWNNILSIIQQQVITNKYGKPTAPGKKQ